MLKLNKKSFLSSSCTTTSSLGYTYLSLVELETGFRTFMLKNFSHYGGITLDALTIIYLTLLKSFDSQASFTRNSFHAAAIPFFGALKIHL